MQMITGQWAVNGAGCHTSSTAPVYDNLYLFNVKHESQLSFGR